MTKRLAILLFLCLSLMAWDRPLYWSSVATVTAAQTLDAHSSWGKYEANPLLRSPDGRFGVRGVAVKSGIVAGSLTVQVLLLRKWPKARKVATITNFVLSGVMVGIAARNYRQ